MTTHCLSDPTCHDDIIIVTCSGPPGPPGPPGTGGSGGCCFYRHTQATPAATWVVDHQLGFRPSVVILVDNQHVYTDIAYPDLDTVSLEFPIPTAGLAEVS